MPAIAHLAPRFIEGGGSGAITATGIGLIVGVGIIPAIILLWVCCWLMICYPHDRTCWCTKSRKRKARESQGDVAGNIPSEETLREKPVHNVSRPAANYRSDSGSSDESARMQRGAPIKTHATRMSVQSVGSHSTIAVPQEPQKFV